MPAHSGRADYIHRVADLLLKDNPKLNPSQVTALDIEKGANCIYPIVGVTEYGWSWVGSDVDPVSIQQACLIVQSNSKLQEHIECRLQKNSQHILTALMGRMSVIR